MAARHLLMFLPCFFSLCSVVVATDLSGDNESPSFSATMDQLDRGLIARQTDQGIYLGWRILDTDPDGIAFNIYKSDKNGKNQKLNDAALKRTSDFLDASDAPEGTTYTIRPIVAGIEQQPCGSVKVASPQSSPSYISIKLDGDHTFQKAGIADLNGDGKLDFVIKQPNHNVDPYVNYWKPSPDTFKLEAYLHDGTFLWRHDLGWAIECGIWYSPYVVYDLNGDGKAEVAVKTGEGDPRDQDGRVQTGPEWLTVLDGMTGEQITKLEWPERELFADSNRPYNYASRNQLCVAYLDGKTPSLIVVRGTYNVIIAVAYRLHEGSLEEMWRWDNRKEPRSYWGQGAHWTQAADVDGDGRQEIILGSAVIDDNGKSLWTTGLGHPDHCYIGDIDPQRPGLEIYYGMESRQKERNGMCLVDAATGEILWGHEGPTRHVHSYGMCSDIDARFEGSECYSADTDSQKKFAWGRLRNAEGKVISEENLHGFGPRCVYWDADPQRELLYRRTIADYGGQPQTKGIEGNIAAVVDILGDWREEIVTSVPGELRIYTTTIPAVDRRTCLMQDPIYRMNVVVAAMGYLQVPMTSYDLATTKTKTED